MVKQYRVSITPQGYPIKNAVQMTHKQLVRTLHSINQLEILGLLASETFQHCCITNHQVIEITKL